MNSTIARRTFTAWMLATTLVASLAAPVLAQNASVTVIVNGQQLSFDQPPVERAGRVFVPLRGVFENLGASVVYSNGVINATGNGRNISLRIGSNQATVNGQTQQLDVAPFLIGARTLVPLRFVAQALGATVDWNNATRTVNITGSGAPSYHSTPQPNASFYLRNTRPSGSVNTQSPAIHANFSEPVRRDTMRVTIDGQDVTNDVYANPNGFDVTPPTPLSAGRHRVRVSGTTQAGASFATGWSFTIGNSSARNFVNRVNPPNGSHVAATFTFSGRTMAGSQVHIVASGSSSALGGLLQLGTGTFQTTVQADSSGYFSTQLSLNNVSGAQIRVLVQSVAPDGTSIERSFTYSM